MPLKENNKTANIIKGSLFAVIAVAVVVGNFFLEERFADGGQILDEGPVSLDYTVENIIPDNGVIRFGGDDFGIVNAMALEHSFPIDNEYVFSVGSGKIWGNFNDSNAKVDIVADRVVLIPDHASFDLDFDGKKLKLAVYEGDVYLGFLEDGVVLEEYVDQYDPIFMNRILVPRDSQVEISMSKVDDRINQLLYSKLVKEFKYSAIPAVDSASAWTKSNMAADQKFLENVKNEIQSEIIFKGTSAQGGTFNDFAFWAEENLTFVSKKRESMMFDHLFSLMDNAIFYATEGDKFASDDSLLEYDLYLATLPADFLENSYYLRRFDEYVERLSVFGPADDQYGLYLELLSRKFSADRDVYEVVDALWLDVYEGIDLGNVSAERALNNYYEYFDSTVGKNVDENFYKNYIIFNNHLVDNLLFRYPTFYNDGYFAIKNALEQELLRLFEDGQLKDELKQALISNKIDFLKRLRTFFFAGEVTINEAKDIFSRLVEEIDDLMSQDTSQLAVVDLFESELADIGDFWGYLNSPEYHTSKTYGANYEERYQSYLKEKDRIWSFINVQEDVLGESVGEKTMNDVVKEIEDVFKENSAVSQFSVGLFEAVDQRYVPIDGVIGGYPFGALYDRDQGTLNEVYTYGELVSDRPVKLSNLLEVLQGKFADLADEDIPQEDQFSEETFAQRAARLYISELVGGYGFEVGIENVSVVDELNALYRVESIVMTGSPDIFVTFDFLMNGETVTNLFLKVEGSPVVLDGKYTLEELKTIVFAEGDLALLEDAGLNVVEGESANNSASSGGGVLR